MSSYIAGDTVRLWAQFNGFDGEAVDPDTVQLSIKGLDGISIDTFESSDLVRTEVGHFEIDYVTPSTPQILCYIFTGLNNGKPMIVRGRFATH